MLQFQNIAVLKEFEAQNIAFEKNSEIATLHKYTHLLLWWIVFRVLEICSSWLQLKIEPNKIGTTWIVLPIDVPEHCYLLPVLWYFLRSQFSFWETEYRTTSVPTQPNGQEYISKHHARECHHSCLKDWGLHTDHYWLCVELRILNSMYTIIYKWYQEISK